MTLEKLAALIAVRNHLVVCQNNRSIATKNVVGQINTVIRSLDQAFVETCLTTDLVAELYGEEPVEEVSDLISDEEKELQQALENYKKPEEKPKAVRNAIVKTGNEEQTERKPKIKKETPEKQESPTQETENKPKIKTKKETPESQETEKKNDEAQKEAQEIAAKIAEAKKKLNK